MELIEELSRLQQVQRFPELARLRQADVIFEVASAHRLVFGVAPIREPAIGPVSPAQRDGVRFTDAASAVIVADARGAVARASAPFSQNSGASTCFPYSATILPSDSWAQLNSHFSRFDSSAKYGASGSAEISPAGFDFSECFFRIFPWS
ncbi:MAG TPA: hypothetical protein DEA50_04160 [Parvularcula sp.]|nr:hypothetical protein [Parvularcula sp.]